MKIPLTNKNDIYLKSKTKSDFYTSNNNKKTSITSIIIKYSK